jgi:hypothetical protein
VTSINNEIVNVLKASDNGLTFCKIALKFVFALNELKNIKEDWEE